MTERSRQAQYELHRAGNCVHHYYTNTFYWCAWNYKGKEDDWQPCPTDYRECPLTKDGEK